MCLSNNLQKFCISAPYRGKISCSLEDSSEIPSFHRTLTPPKGDIGGYPIPQYRKKNWQIPKNRVENRRNTDTIFMIGNAYSKFYPSHMFVYLKHLCTSNQPQPLRGNVRLPRTDQKIEKDALLISFIID